MFYRPEFGMSESLVREVDKIRNLTDTRERTGGPRSFHEAQGCLKLVYMIWTDSFSFFLCRG